MWWVRDSANSQITLHVGRNSYKSCAFCRAGSPYRLLSEAEHHAMRNSTSAHAPDSVKAAESLQTPAAMHAADSHAFSSGAELRQQKAANLQLAYGAEAPVDAFNGPQASFSHPFHCA